MSYESANQCLLVGAPVSKTRLKRFPVSVLQSLCVEHALKVHPSGARGKAIKVDYIQALINLVRLQCYTSCIITNPASESDKDR